jgi:hypothetical protein
MKTVSLPESVHLQVVAEAAVDFETVGGGGGGGASYFWR